MTSSGFEETVAVLGGATSGIGLECAAQLGEAGCRGLVINGRDAERANRAVTVLRSRAPRTEIIAVVADISKPEGAQRVVGAAMEIFGRIDVLVNAASGATLTARPFEQIPLDLVDDVFAIHFRTALNLCHAAYPQMVRQRRGSIVNFASDGAKIATPGQTIHGAAQAAVMMMTRVLALEGARYGVRANCVLPSVTRETGTYNRVMAEAFAQRLYSKAEGRARLGVPTPVTIAPMVVFLASERSAHITGQAISINGGISAA